VVGSVVGAQTANKCAAPSNDAELGSKETTLDGCLYGGPDEFELIDPDNVYSLRGQASILRKHVGEEVSVQGIQREERDHVYSLDVTSVKQVFKAPQPQLSESIANASNWHIQLDKKYGVKFALPRFPSSATTDGEGLLPNFVAKPGTVTIAGLGIPREIYPTSNFIGGAFLLSVNPQITNRESCEKFGTSDPRFLSYATIAGVRYAEMTEGDAAMGSSHELQYFHTFQHGLCFEAALSMGVYNPANQDFGCRVPMVSDTTRVVEEFTRRISYFRSTETISTSHPNQIPQVTLFTAPSKVADDARNNSSIVFSWATENADYVELSYDCSVVGLGVVILEGEAGSRNCQNDSKPIVADLREFTHSPNSSAEISFGNSHHDDPISIVVTITPFSHGVAYPTASRSLTISVNPYNPFPQGIPDSTANITLTYFADENSSYSHGSSLTIKWTDALSRDPCVNLYLVQDTTGGHHYLAQIVDECLRPAAAGFYTWKIPDKYSGTGFRIYAAAPGLSSSAFGPVFSIIPTSKRE